MINTQANSALASAEKKGVPGFSQRLDSIFDLAGTPSDSRLSWGAKRWNVAPNTVRNWLTLDTPPQHFSTLDLVVADLLQMMNSRVDKTAVIGWLYAGGTNPFDSNQQVIPSNISLLQQIQIFNSIYPIAKEFDIDLNNFTESKVNKIIKTAFLYCQENALKIEIVEKEVIINFILDSLASS